MTNYNPHSACMVGLEWFAYRDSIFECDSALRAVAAKLVAETTDTIESVWTALSAVTGELGGSALSLEVFDITATGVFPQPALAMSTYYPSSDLYVAVPPWTPGAFGPFNGWNPALGGAGPFWDAINSPTLTPYTWPLSGQPVDNDQFVFNFFGLGFDFATRFGGVTGTQAGRWITRVRARTVVAQYYAADVPGPVTIKPYLWINGQKFAGEPQSVTFTQGPVELVYDWYANPATGLPWTATDIDDFDTAGGSPSNGIGWIAQPTNSANNLATILQGQLQIESSATDPRLAIAALWQPSPTQGWHEFALKDPADGTASDITFVAGNTYLFLIRRSTGLANFSLIRVEDPDAFLPGPPNWSSYTPKIDTVSHRAISLGTESGAALPISLVRNTSAVSLDSQPYMTTSPLEGLDQWPLLNEYYDNSPVNVDLSMQQDFTPVTVDDYGWIFVLLAMVSESSDGDLEIVIRDRGTDTQQGSTVVITAADLVAPRHRWQRVGMRLPTTLAALTAQQYYFDITSTASPDQGWLVQVLNSGIEPPPTGPPAGSSDANFGGGVDTLWIGDPLVSMPEMDAAITISILPDAPANLTAVSDGESCCMDHIIVEWDEVPGLTCGGFLAYELQRLDRPSASWQRIAYITDEDAITFNDWESRRNMEASYRVRVFRADGTPSDWSDTAEATALMVNCAGYMFTSNEDPTLSAFYQDIEGVRQYGYPTNIDTFQPEGQDGQIVYREIQDRFRTFKRRLRVRDGRGPVPNTVWQVQIGDYCLVTCDDQADLSTDVFEPLRDIGRAGLSYVCVHDENGGRYFAFINVSAGFWEQHGVEGQGGWASYIADLDVIELTNVPSSPDQVAP